MSTESPEPGVTIVRDKQFGVPHIYGDTRAALMFGIGWATAEDRLFFIDVLRHAGQGDLAQFAGGANVSMDQSVWASEPYTQQDLVNQVNYGLTHSVYGREIYSDATNYVAGINAYIAAAKKNPLLMPAEYGALLAPQGPQPFTLEDLVSIATLVGGIFGNGGGDQLNNAILYEALRQRIRSRAGERRRLAGAGASAAPQARDAGPLRFRHLPQHQRRRRSRGADDRARHVVSRTRRCRSRPRRHSRRSRFRTQGRCSSSITSSRARCRGPLRTAHGRGPTRAPACSRSRARCRTRCWSAPRTVAAVIRSR